MELTEAALAGLFEDLGPHLGERQRRLLAGALSKALGRGGQSRVVEASGMSSHTVWRGAKEIREGIEPIDGERAEGAGAKSAAERQPGLVDALDELVDPGSRGDPMSPLRWTSKSTYELAGALQEFGFKASAELVRRMLHGMGYSLQATAKQNEGRTHPDRDGQFRFINDLAAQRLDSDEPVISVDTKKKELVGDYANGGREWQPKGEPERVDVHDFPKPGSSKAVPYGIYDIANDEGWVSVGDSGDTAEFATATIRRWWDTMGANRFPDATRLMITADCGGSNGYRVRAWKWHLQALADHTGLEITVAHYPPGTSKWNRIEHRLFSYISMNWRGRPLTDIATIVNLIAATTTTTGLTVQAHYDPANYQTGIKISDTQMEQINITRHDWHGDWNYTIKPGPPPP